MKSKILLFDIEATSLNAPFGTILCMGWMWYGQKRARVLRISDYPGWEEDPTDDKRLLIDIQKKLAEADVLVGWYSGGYDLPMIQTRMLQHRLGVLAPVAHIDLWWWARHRLKMHSNRLAAVSEFFGLGEKTPVIGRSWVKAAAGDMKSLLYVYSHCKKDVEVLGEAYEVMRPLVTTHPTVSKEHPVKTGQCRVCGGKRLIRQGFKLTSVGQKRRFQCGDCAAWMLG